MSFLITKGVIISVKKRWLPKPFSIFVAVVVLFAAASNSLTGCSGGTPMARVFGGFNSSFSRSYENSADYQRFRQIYNKYAAKDGNRIQQIRHFSDAYIRVRSEYVHKIPDKKLIGAAISGIEKLPGKPGQISSDDVVEAALDSMLASLDPHSSYLNPEEFRESQVVTSGQFGGLGIEINMEDGLIKIISPIADTPAHRAGLKAGDLITHVDGDPIKGMSLMESVRRLRGRPRTDVRLTIRRQGHGDFQVTITRAIIQVQPVKWHLESDVGVIRLTHFIQSSEEALEEAVSQIRGQGNGRMKGIVLDLRNNPGGLLNQSVAVADAFLDHGKIVSVRDRIGEVRGYTAHSGDLASGLPIVVLINRGSASASEIVAGALQDHGRATVMGVRSFGKGSVQTIAPLDWDGALRLTTALYYLPSDRTIQGFGVTPNISVHGKDGSDGRREADLPNALPGALKGSVGKNSSGSLREDKCPEAGRKKDDKLLGCALMLLRSGSHENFLALMGARKSL